MIDIHRKYQFSFFGNMADIQPSADTIPVFLEMFRDKGFLPSTFQEIRLPNPTPEIRLKLSSPDQEWAIDLDTARLSFTKNSIKPKGINLGTVEGFIRDVIDFCSRLLRRFPKKASRLSLVTEGLMREMQEEELRLIYEKLFKPIPFYQANPSIGWQSRYVARVQENIQGNSELINVVTWINRTRGKLADLAGLLPFDRIEIKFDINTFQGNTDTRFGIESVSPFLQSALELRARLIRELEVHFYG
jgi:hypothetical protein